MKVHLLYPDREWKKSRSYYHAGQITDDLGLKILFTMASREQSEKEGTVKNISEEDIFLSETLEKVMMVPLENEKDIYHRQDILKDFIEKEDFLKELYAFAKDIIIKWEKIGRKEPKEKTYKATAGALISKIHLLELFVDGFCRLKELVRGYGKDFSSAGLIRFVEGLETEFNINKEESLKKILKDLSFFADSTDEETERGFFIPTYVKMPKIVMECSLKNGMKLNTMKLEEVESVRVRYRKPKKKQSLAQVCMGAFAPSSSDLTKDDYLYRDTKRMEQQVTEYVLNSCNDFLTDAKNFFEQLEIQTAFYLACFHLYEKSVRVGLPVCFPRVCEQENMKFENLMEFCMAVYNRKCPVGNSLEAKNKLLLVVTGANQGGKSTFLRSIGIAQIMLQCGMFVSADSFESGLYRGFFTHFTRREDSEMNSGRLDEEMRRMKDIVEHLEEKTMVLLNESFATTTEKEGAVIAYDITKALVEQNVKVLTVTHLLAFARKVYEEKNPLAEFVSAERKEDGSRTYRMISCEPEFTSFGLDLYEKIIGGTQNVHKNC